MDQWPRAWIQGSERPKIPKLPFHTRHPSARRNPIKARDNGEILVQNGASINQPSRISIEGFAEHLPASLYPLHLVASRGLSSLLAHFLANKTTHIDVQDFFGFTALNCACSAGRTDAAVQLLEAGASPDMVKHRGDTALHDVAARSGRVECVRALCSHGATIDVVNSEGETPLQLAEKAGNLDVAAEILRQIAIQNRTGLATTTTTTAAAATAADQQSCKS